MPEIDLTKEPRLHRGPVSRGLYRAAPTEAANAGESPVDRDGGRFNAGLIRGLSVITRGEALGHGEWIDSTMLAQVAEAGKTLNETGVKSRFAHPDMSGDGIGKMTGKTFDPSVKGDQVIADWHALKSAHKTPDGDLAGYVMDLAEEAPESFGTSISFMPDYAAMRKFREDNMTEIDSVDSRGQPTKIKVFRSPDPLNTKHLPHVRLKELIAVDVVDEPAANPGGLFHRGPFELLENGDRVLEYTFGLTEEAPEISNLGIDPSRLRGFVQRFCQSRGITFSKGKEMAEENPKAPANDVPPADTKTELNKTPVEAPKPEVDVAALSKSSAEEAIKAERKRAADINALCKQAGKMELAAGFVEDGTEVADVQAKLFTALCNDRPPVGPDTKPAEEKLEDKGPNAKYIAEWKASAALQSAMTQDDYVKSRRIDDGVDVLGFKAA